jgi:hypothetical protein
LQVLEKITRFNDIRQLLDAASEGSLGVLKELMMKKNIDVNVRNGLGNTALHESVRNGHSFLVEWLLRSKNAEVGLADNDGNTALHFAVTHNSVSIVRLLLENGADIQIKNKAKRSALEIARDNARTKLWKGYAGQTQRDWKNDPIYWQLTHRPFPFVSESVSIPAKARNSAPKAPTGEALEACNHHSITAVEFFVGIRPRPEWRSMHLL